MGSYVRVGGVRTWYEVRGASARHVRNNCTSWPSWTSRAWVPYSSSTTLVPDR
jgi:hypothetical protein